MKTTQKIVTNLINKNMFSLKAGSLRQDGWYLGLTNLCQNAHSTE